jgi:hypothetical protein
VREVSIEQLAADAERFRRLQVLTDAALSSLDLEELLAVLLDRTRAVLEVDTCAVLLLRRKDLAQSTRHSLGIGRRTTNRSPRWDSADGYRRVISTSAALQASTTSS